MTPIQLALIIFMLKSAATLDTLLSLGSLILHVIENDVNDDDIKGFKETLKLLCIVVHPGIHCCAGGDRTPWH